MEVLAQSGVNEGNRLTLPAAIYTEIFHIRGDYRVSRMKFAYVGQTKARSPAEPVPPPIHDGSLSDFRTPPEIPRPRSPSLPRKSVPVEGLDGSQTATASRRNGPSCSVRARSICSRIIALAARLIRSMPTASSYRLASRMRRPHSVAVVHWQFRRSRSFISIKHWMAASNSAIFFSARARHFSEWSPCPLKRTRISASVKPQAFARSMTAIRSRMAPSY